MTKQESKQFKLEDYLSLPNPGLRAYFSHVRNGQPDEYRTPFYKGRSLDDIVDGWTSKLLNIEDKWPSLYQYELDQGKKVGPMSVMFPLEDRIKDVDSYYDLRSPEVQAPSDEALLSAQQEWRGVYPLRMRSANNTVLNMKLNTNSGTPYFTKRKSVIDKTLPLTRIMKDGLEIVPQDSNKFKYAAILGWRGQEGGRSKHDVKQRVIWMFPFEVNIWELRVYQPLIQAFQKLNLVPAWVGQDSVDNAITWLYRTKPEDDLVIATDFDSFDQSINPTLQRIAFDQIESLFKYEDTDVKSWLEHIFSIKYNIPLILDESRICRGPHGMGSGSGGTNVDETLIHRTLQYEAAHDARKKLNPFSQCLGDDGIITYPGCTVDKVVKSYTKFGLEMNLTKQHASTDDLIYLRRWYHKFYVVNGINRGVYPTCRALGRLCEQERYYSPETWGRDMVALRQLSIIENCKWHPLREEFADYCMAGDSYKLGLGIPGFFDNLGKLAKEAIDDMPDFLGYVRSIEDKDPSQGINDWWIVKYLKSKA